MAELFTFTAMKAEIHRDNDSVLTVNSVTNMKYLYKTTGNQHMKLQ